ncbi:MAG: hypothetical protein E6R03_06200 [Hyphomicrobiaceae bacterium]|nr:MAG: hypothetical protein E6R03_06200 [Hyphomicrobiaceae bacterium]
MKEAPTGFPGKRNWLLEVELRCEAKKALKLLAVSHAIMACPECPGAENCRLVTQAEQKCLEAGCNLREISSVWHYAQARAIQ